MKEQVSNIMKFIFTGYYIDGVSVLKYPECDLLMLHQSKRKTSFEKGKKDNLTYT